MGSSNLVVIMDLLIFGYIIAALINPDLWINKPEKKGDKEERKKMRIIALVLLLIEIVFVSLEYVF